MGESYRIKVEEAIRKLNHRVNSINRSLARRGYRMLRWAADYAPDQEQAYVIMAEQQKVDGIICLSYNPKLQVFDGVPLMAMGLRVPEDVQVIGYDSIRHFDDMDYTCSTIVQPVEEMAEVCVDMVLEKEDSKSPSLVCLPVSYAYGGTTKK